MFYIFLADGFEETEALCPWDLIKRTDIAVKTVSINKTNKVTGAHGLAVCSDITESELEFSPENLDGIMLPGGMPGATNLNNCKTVQDYITIAHTDSKLICAICAAPFILGQRGLLKTKQATCFPGFEDKLHGALLSDKKVVTDGNIITAAGMGAAFDFGCEIIKYFKGEEYAASLRKKTMA